jgi:chromosome segregation ATPase
MNQEEGSGNPRLIGRPVEEAVEAVLDADDSRDRETVRGILETVAEDGTVSESALQSRLGKMGNIVSTPENRVEFAAMEIDDAKETAEREGVLELDTVRSRVEGYESRLEAAEDRISTLGPELREIARSRKEGANAYEVASDLRELEAEANELHRTADELQVDAEEFGRWLTDPGTRYEELEGEIEAVERSLAALSGTADDLDADDDEGEGASSSLPAEPGVVWADASLRTRVTALLLADIEAELDDLRAWPGREGSDDRLDELGTRLGELEGECRDLEERLDDLARPAWTDRFGDRLDDLEDELDRFAPPVSWGEVEAELERHRETLGAA